ncbi:uncharacterized protein LOC115885549 [Sitophilus oryzae]|uniref:Uncharacterized protein LOC115885549 n=1 Tax=Sitophilus oryzae TaxID=7048 RepID=A0A6J2YAY7_SITOR|nr:uncharacterized protein LOC115885549 [Sitophilus oryzae]
MSGYMKRILAVVRIGMSGTCSKFDCDFDLPNSSNKLLTEDSSSISSQVPIVPTEVISNEDIAAEEITIDKDSSDAAEIISLSSWQTWNPQQLRQPKSIELTVPEPNNTDLEDTNEQVTKTIGVTPCCSNDVKKTRRVSKVESIGSKLKNKRAVHFETLQEELLKKKIALVELQTQVLQEEREQKKGLIEAQIKILREETEQKKINIAEKHKLEIDILLAELKNKN